MAIYINVDKRHFMKFGLGLILLVSLNISTAVFGQEKSSNNDLRVKRAIFQIRETSKKKGETYYKLLTTINGQFNFEITKDKKVESSRKVDSSDAIKIDDKFVDSFISFKYLMKENPQKKCIEKYYLNLRGEDQVICQNEDEKIKKLEQFIGELRNKFS